MINIREYKEADIRKVAELCINNWKESYAGILKQDCLDELTINSSIAHWNNHFLLNGAKIFIAEEEKEFCGFIAIHDDEEIDNCIYISSLHIHQNQRGKGIGTELIRYIGGYAYSKYQKMSICILKGNDGAKKLYERLGAEHFKDFEDNFHDTGTITQSEKLIWQNIDCFQ